jgi:hypothetical protein
MCVLISFHLQKREIHCFTGDINPLSLKGLVSPVKRSLKTDKTTVKYPAPYRAVNTVSFGYENNSMICYEIIAVFSEVCKKHINIFWGQMLNF